MTLELPRRLHELVRQGMRLVGSKPQRTPSLLAYPQSDAEFTGLAQQLWGDLDGTTVTQRSFGKGRVFWGRPLRATLWELGIGPDFDFCALCGCGSKLDPQARRRCRHLLRRQSQAAFRGLGLHLPGFRQASGIPESDDRRDHPGRLPRAGPGRSARPIALGPGRFSFRGVSLAGTRATRRPYSP